MSDKTVSEKKKKPSRKMSKKKRARLLRRRRRIAAGSALGAVLVLVLVVVLVNRGDPVEPVTSGGVGRAAEASPAPEITDGADMAGNTSNTGPEITATPVPTPTAEPQPDRAFRTVGPIAPSASPGHSHYDFKERVYDSKGEDVKRYAREAEIHMGAGDSYTDVEGVLTFRGNNYRDNAVYGTVPDNPKELDIEWSVRVGGIDDWSGVGWTGQPALVRWPDQTRLNMNINSDKKKKDGLVEVIYAALDGKIRFLDLDDGKETRSAIKIGAPIKGSVSVDPRGYPLLYCGQGIDTVRGKSVKIGTRVFSLIDQKELLFIDGRDKYRTRNWYAFDAAPLVHAETDTMLQIGENNVVYSIDLNTDYDAEMGKISIDPKIERYTFKSKVSTRPGMENSLAIYNEYGYFVDNSGLLVCLNLNTLSAEWIYDCSDDTDATCAIEEQEDGLVALYTGCEMDLRAKSGDIYMRKFNALTGELLWTRKTHVTNNSDSGVFGSPGIGKGSLGDLVFFNVARTDDGGTLYALNKETGETAWTLKLNRYSWSTPALIYDESGRGYVIIGNSQGRLALVDGLKGDIITYVKLEGNIEGSPAVFDDMIVVGTRGGHIYGVRIS